MATTARVIAVYEIRNTISGTFYIGSSANLYERWRAHRKRLRAGTHHNPRLQASWNKHGESAFAFIKLAECERVSDMGVLEDALLQLHRSNAACCNIAAWHDTPMRGVVGDAHPNYGRVMSDEQKALLSKATTRQWEVSDPRTGHKHSDETREKIKAKVRAAVADGRGGRFIPSEETRAKMSLALKGNKNAKGHVRSEEHRRKLSESQKGNQHWAGKAHSEESKAKMGQAVRMISPKGEVTVYPRTTAIKEQFGIFLPTVLRSVRSGKPLAKGPYTGWRFEYV